MSVVFFAAIAAAAFWELLKAKIPEIPRVPWFPIEKLRFEPVTTWTKFLYPFSESMYFFALVLHRIIDAVWRMVAIISFYLLQFALILTRRAQALLANKKLWKIIIMVAGSYFVIISWSKIVLPASKLIEQYLICELDMYSCLKNMYLQIIYIVFFFVGSLVALSIIRPLWFGPNEWKVSLDRHALAGAVVILAFVLGSLFVYVFQKINLSAFVEIDDLAGFAHLGPLFVIALSVFIAAILYAIGLMISEYRKRKAADSFILAADEKTESSDFNERCKDQTT